MSTTKRKSLDSGIVCWLKDEINMAESDMMEAEWRADHYTDALERYKAKGSLPRDVRNEYRALGRHR